MDRMSRKMFYNDLFRKYGFIFAVLISIFGLALMILISAVFSFVGLSLDLCDNITFNFLTSGLSRFIAFIILIIIADKYCLCGRLGLGFKNIGESFKSALFGYAVAFGFFIDSFSMNLFLKNKLCIDVMLWTLFVCITVGLFEETLIRGLAMNILKIKFWRVGKWFYILLQALIFMGLHSVNYILGDMTLTQVKTQFVVTFLMGIYYGWVYEKTHSLFGVAILHGFYDFCVSTSGSFMPTGDRGFVYADVGLSIIIYSVLFYFLFVSIRKLVRSIKMYRTFDENFN